MKSKVWCFVFGVLLCGQVAWGADRVKLELVGEVQLPVPKSIAVDGTYAYVGVDQGINKEAPHILYVINVETSNKPQVIASLPVRLSVDDIALQNGFAYLVGQAYQETEQGLSVVDVRDPEHPNVVGRYDTAFSGYYQHASVAVRGTRCYMALGHLFVLDTSDPSEPILLETVDPDVFYEGVRDPYPQSSFVSCLWTDENEAYLGLFFHGFGPDQDCAEPAVQRITLTSPIAGIGHVLSTEAVVRGITKVGGHMVCAMDSTVLLLDSQLDTPRVVGKCPRTTIWSGVEAYQNHAFFGGMANAHSDLGNNVDRVEVLDVSDTIHPMVVCAYDDGGPYDGIGYSINGLAVQDDYVYAGSPRHGFQIFRITELPAITRQLIQDGKLNLRLEWNELARGMKLQRSPSLENPDWEDVDGFGTESTNAVSITAWGRQEYFRLAFDAPENMVWIPAGTFMMGSPETEQDRQPNEGPQTEVTLTQGFFMGKHEVTQGEYLAVMGENPSWFNGIQKIYDEQSSSYIDFDYGVDLNRPVEFVTWDDAIAYCEALTTQERASNRIPQGYAYQLPTEAQWEVACRGGTMTRFSFGNDPEYTELTNYAWYKDNSDNQTHPVGQKLANPWGLYDMHGNVIEWCQDRWTFELPGGSEVDPRGPESGSGARVVRGGSWFDWETGSRSAARMQSRYLAFGVGYIGFRVVLAPARP